MNLNKTKTGLMLLMLSVGYVHAQEAVPAAGGDASGGNGSMSYSVGQVVYTAGSGTNGSLNQGVQQPYEISTSSTGDELDGIRLSVFPNPASDVLMLHLENASLSECSYALYNNQGQLIREEAITSLQVSIPMQELQSATYVLKVTSANAGVKSFTIVKH